MAWLRRAKETTLRGSAAAPRGWGDDWCFGDGCASGTGTDLCGKTVERVGHEASCEEFARGRKRNRGSYPPYRNELAPVPAEVDQLRTNPLEDQIVSNRRGIFQER